MNKYYFLKVFSLSLLIFIFYSCVPHKKVVLLQNKSLSRKDSLQNYRFRYKVQPKDILYISINSFNEKVTEFFNIQPAGGLSSKALIGYTVSEEGYIKIPMADSIYVKGLTLNQIQDKIQIQLKDYVADFYVIVNLINFKVTVLGEVKVPGIKEINNDENTMLEILGMAGDFTDFANRREVKLIRTENGSSKIFSLDFTNRDIIESEYYYAMPNDVIYVEPIKAKVIRSNISQITLFVSVTSLLIVIINLLKR